MLVSKHNQPTSYTYLYAKDKLPYRYAVHYCQTHGGQLPSVHSLEDNLNLLRIGLLYRNIKRGHEHVVPGFWLGAESVRGDKKFEWVDGTPWNFEHWFDRQPDRPGSAENCIEVTLNLQLETNDGMLQMVSYSPAKWNNVKCDLKLHFICKLPSN
ncbi:hypothetical protein L596_010190 [Steinernema carpocapsae]|uniref:C-type lectin domain-containing protein n=1 Tax=Steinernema carpocapsae TaxID=34508 RepID=A0A4U5PHL5_STECR|nr:hypothetical protein L596_010190 [Steinernema carpocapsae]